MTFKFFIINEKEGEVENRKQELSGKINNNILAVLEENMTDEKDVNSPKVEK